MTDKPINDNDADKDLNNRTDSANDAPAQPKETVKKGWFGRLKDRFSKDSSSAQTPSEPESEASSELPAAETTADSTTEPAVEPAIEPTAEQATEPAAEQVAEPDAEQVPEPAIDKKSIAEESIDKDSIDKETIDKQTIDEQSVDKKSADAAAASPQSNLNLAPSSDASPISIASSEQTSAAQDATETTADTQTAADAETATDAETTKDLETAAKPETAAAPETTEDAKADPPKKGFFGRLREKLAATREVIAGRLERLLSAVREIDENVLDELEEILITSDLGVKTTNDILYKIKGQVAKKELKDSDALKNAIKARISEMIAIAPPSPIEANPLVVMVVGVNGVGKTTTIAKLANLYIKEGKKVLLAAGDTFRAAAVEQLTIWAQRLGCEIVSQPTGADPSAVVYDSISAAKARKADIVIIDTAGRLHTKVNLMEELKKIKRVANKALPGAPHKTILVLDANTGQNAASQAQTFHQNISLDCLIVTKLDGTSKGGVIVSIINEYKLPVTHIGLGESLDDLRPFEPQAFVEAILNL
ncbi:MAG: signal recognition particle-docking protein FtsY [Deltaproteobacteria bacterium]|jgi:fused signal recognition particle receptor|nr:signal recognition particle-docking protein FtsY [Deltaproteobacteria bacterium]